jgi:hypothetical protein
MNDSCYYWGDGMSLDKLQDEAEAVQSLLSLYELARKTKQLYDRAGLAIPERLLKFITSDNADSRPTGRSSMKVPRPPDRKAPEWAGDEWIWVEVNHCTPTTLIPAVIRSSSVAMSGQQVIDRVQELNPLLNRGSIYNAANRLVNNGTLDRSDREWKLKTDEPTAKIDGQLAWGPDSVFQLSEKASLRREAILYLLGQYESGLMVVQLVEQLKNSPWMKAPANKDLLKDDVKKLFGEGKIRKVGNTQKWALVIAEKGE